MDKPSNIWAKLVSLHPDKENIHFPIKKREKNLHQIENACKIYQDPTGNTYIQSLTKTLTKVNQTQLGKNKNKMLFGGETISLCEKNKQFDYIFCLVNAEPENNKLKRNREDGLERVSTTLSELSKKLFKIEDNLRKELNCTICMDILHRRVALTPCQHTFCSSCLLNHLRTATNCPLCKVQAVSITKSLILQNLLEFSLKNFPNLRNSRDDLIQGQIELRGDIVRFQDGVYVGDHLNGKKEGKGIFGYNDGQIYEGDWKNDKRDGLGVLIKKNGTKFKGKWSDDVMEPLGEIHYLNGRIYNGEIKDFEKHGKGVFMWPSGDLYEGDFNKDLKQGFGKYFYKRGGEYQGDWAKGNKHGQGTMKYSNGDIYKGKWRYGFREGKGVLLKQNGDKYEGYWEEDELYRFGKCLYENGAEYEGGWRRGKRHGYGTMRYSNGNLYSGLWSSDKKWGKGILKLRNGNILESAWYNDNVSAALIKYPNGDYYKGVINPVNFKRQNYGVLTRKNGRQIAGWWKNDNYLEPF